MKLRLGDTIGLQGRDFRVAGLLSYRLGGKAYRLARVLDADTVRWLEPLMDDMDDRVLWFEEVKDLAIAPPPPATIAYRGQSFVPRIAGQAQVTVSGEVPGRADGAVDLWRYRAAGDVFVQIERWPDRVVTLRGESIHKDLVNHIPGPAAA